MSVPVWQVAFLNAAMQGPRLHNEQYVASKVARERAQKVIYGRFSWASLGHIPLVRTLSLATPNCKRG